MLDILPLVVKTLLELTDLLQKYKINLSENNFLIYDSRDDDDKYDNKEKVCRKKNEGYGERRNMELLGKLYHWF